MWSLLFRCSFCLKKNLFQKWIEFDSNDCSIKSLFDVIIAKLDSCVKRTKNKNFYTKEILNHD